MLNFKAKLRQEVIDQDLRKDLVYSFSATALPGNRTRGKYCRIKFKNENGENEIVEGEIDSLYGNESTGGWYPKQNEKVKVNRIGNVFTIVSPLIEDYESHIKDYELKCDVFSGMITGSAPSILF